MKKHLGTKSFFVIAAVFTLATLAGDALAQTKTTKIRYALGDIVTHDDLNLLIALDRAKARGVEVEITPFKSEDLATQAVINGQADIGQGTPYAVIQKLKAPVRFFYQLSALQFFPVVDKSLYKTWKDLDGQDIVVHSRGSGTEAIMSMMAKHHGIKYKSVSYVPGSEVRALAMLKGNIKASIVDNTNKNLLMKEAPDKFLVLPLGEIKASDEALFATNAFLDANKAAVGILLEELLKVWREINKDPAFAVRERQRLGLLKDLPAKLEGEVEPYFKQAVAGGIFPNDGGLAGAVKNDFEFFTASGALQGTPQELKADDFWNLAPLKAALAKVGG
ncbi:MAG: ABC transporter substrate-binding protein [Rhodospirillales bacterium]|nr:ABC transporter substrate-binding protein [Rhodospirillales bacterium]